MPANSPLNYYSRMTLITANAGGGLQRLLTNGAAGTGYNGTFTFAANLLGVGDIIRFMAWGTWGPNSR